ncbi:MAG: hypothetical protein Q8K98_07670 [Bacteroidota bacterium]|nr:hypothetical protein [Bacteroidota bacterium]
MLKILSKILLRILKALVGLILIFIFHIPRFLFSVMEISYAYVFNNQSNLTANPEEHLKRAKKMLNKNKNSLLLYVAIEIRFALERMIQHQLLLTDKISKRMLDEYNPVKKQNNILKLEPDSEFAHNIYFINKETNQKILWGAYKPFDSEKIKYIQGRLGDLLHPKDGIALGISNDKWYLDTREFLISSYKYLSDNLKDNYSFFLYKGIDNFELEKVN